MSAVAKGYAFMVNDEIDIRTVSPTEIGAIVNALVVRFEIVPANHVSDALIREVWDRAIIGLGEPGGIVEVEITEV